MIGSTALLLVMAIAAPASDGDAPGLDLLLLIDRSGSMSSPAQRKLAAASIDLSLTMAARATRQQRVRHRVGIVSFGSTARIDLPLTVVDDAAMPVIREVLSAADSQRSLGNTDFAEAFDAAAGAFTGEPPRRRAILLISDGRAHVPGVSRDESMRRLNGVLRSRFRSPVDVDVILFGGGDDAWRDLPHTRIHRAGGERDAALATLHGVVSDLLGTTSQEREISGAFETIELPPYLDLVIFDLIGDRSREQVSFFAPGTDQPLDLQTPGVEEVRFGGALTTVVVHRPLPGFWTFRKTQPSSRVRVLAQQFFPRGILLAPDSRALVRRHERVAITYRLLDENGAALRQLPDYPLTVDMTLAAPDGRRVSLAMSRAATADVYRANAATACDVPGRYWTEVAVTAVGAGGRAVRVFDDRWSGFSVDAGAAAEPPRMSAAMVQASEPRRRRSTLVAAAVFTLAVLAAVFRPLRRLYVARRQTRVA
jgi:hypothetical protein